MTARPRTFLSLPSPLRLLLALIAMVAGIASGATLGGAETAVAANNIEPAASVEADANIPAGHVGSEPAAFDDWSSGCCVAPNTRMSGATTVGRPDHASSNMRKFSNKNPESGYYDVVGHGSPRDIAGMSPTQLADRIREASGGQNIRLLSCEAGCPTGNFAQDLADNLGVRVMAPTTDISASNSGATLTIHDGGEWRWFDPN